MLFWLYILLIFKTLIVLSFFFSVKCIKRTQAHAQVKYPGIEGTQGVVTVLLLLLFNLWIFFFLSQNLYLKCTV